MILCKAHREQIADMLRHYGLLHKESMADEMCPQWFVRTCLHNRAVMVTNELMLTTKCPACLVDSVDSGFVRRAVETAVGLDANMAMTRN